MVMISILTFFSFAGLAQGLIKLSIKDGEIRDVLRMMGEQSGINIVPDASVRGQVTLNLTDVTVEEALQILLKVYKYNYEKVNDNSYIISQQPLTEPYLVEVEDDKLTLIAQAIDIKRVLNDVSKKGQMNIIYDQSVNGQVNANLISVDLVNGLKSLCSANNLMLMNREGIYAVTSGMGSQQGRQMAVSISDGLISIDVKNGDLSDLLRSIAEQSGLNIVLFGGNHQLVDLRIDDVPVEEALQMILSGTRYTFRKEKDVYLIGDKSINSPSSALLTRNEVVHLKYLQAEKVPAMLPNIFPATNIKVIKELNALAVTGTQQDIEDLKEYLNSIDKKIPQIVVEAIIIEVNRRESDSPLFKFGIRANEKEGGQVLLDSLLGKLTYSSVIKLTPEFYLTLEDLVSQGVANLKAKPKITTLNGHQAKINVGKVQYYKVVSSSDKDDESKTQTEYQSINAGITLDVIPWVSSTGEITLELHPSISNLGTPAADGPPGISQRQIDTTVRVKSGETIVIGGLIQDDQSETLDKVPLLGDLPWIGQLFQQKITNLNQTELIMYITPHILDELSENITQEAVEETIQDMRNRYNN